MTETRRGGPRALAAMLPRIARPAFGKRGFVEASVLTDWPVIVGSVLAEETRPMRLSFPRGARAEGLEDCLDLDRLWEISGGV